MTGIPTVELGDGLATSAQGLGGMALTDVYGAADPDQSVATINHAIDIGVTFLDTANVYGQGANEELFARVLRHRRAEVVLATKFGILPTPDDGGFRARGDAAYVHESIDASLKRLGTDSVDLYYYHRVDSRVPIEETVGALAELVTAGKVRHIGLSEVTALELERAHAVHPIAAVQSEWSLWSRDVEEYVIPTAARLGIGFVAYSPLGRGFLTGGVTDATALGEKDARRNFPRFSDENFAANVAAVEVVRQVADVEGLTPAQVALAWVYASGRRLGVPVVPIPGTRKAHRVDENAAAVTATLSDASLARLDGIYAGIEGERASDPLYISRGREQREHAHEHRASGTEGPR
ncbi:aldo/keto reductase [Mycetocola zhujimingii]|uniref:Aldo/keto reductase n=1 Tax=Mycetocola zhujimingii TaxID=2079792 RepID=A0A2U1TFB3_9MICO|nr:aldo/keto reductase [Mycetocola zhujimingii]PWC07564.1 aldo/keto reductase [Mycetocola zhujimingii]